MEQSILQTRTREDELQGLEWYYEKEVTRCLADSEYLGYITNAPSTLSNNAVKAILKVVFQAIKNESVRTLDQANAWAAEAEKNQK